MVLYPLIEFSYMIIIIYAQARMKNYKERSGEYTEDEELDRTLALFSLTHCTPVLFALFWLLHVPTQFNNYKCQITQLGSGLLNHCFNWPHYAALYIG